MESFLVLPKWTLKSLRSSILLSGFSKALYGQVVDTSPFAASVQEPN